MKVLFQNRPKEQWQGGDMIQLEKTQQALLDKGIEVYFNDEPLFSPALLLQTFDIVHTWNFSMEWTKFQIWAAKKHGRKIVCSMIYHETDRFVEYDLQQIMLDACDACIFLSQGEVERVKRHLKIDESKIHIIPNGIDAWWFNPTTEKNKHGKYVLTVGRVEGAKGQLAVSEACKQLGIKYLCAGEIIEADIAKKIHENGGVILGKLTPEGLKPLYKHAKAMVLASQHEIFPLSVMEAGSQSTNIVLTEGSEWKDIPNVELCKFGDVESIKSAIEKAISKPKNTEFRDKLKTMTWSSVADQILSIYSKI